MKLNPVYQTVLDLLANEIFHGEREFLNGIDWKEVYQECLKQTVTLHGLKAAKSAAVLPADVAQEWEKAAVSAAYHNFRVAWEHNHLDEIMRSEKIPYVVLKGGASAIYYSRAEDRILGDVDFLVRRSDLEHAGKALEQDGFVPWKENHICHIVYQKEQAHLEMHFEPAGVPHGRSGEKVREYLADIMEQSQEISYENGKICVPSVFHHGLILLLHTSHHLLGEGIGLRHLCDWAVFSSGFSEVEFRETFEEKLKEVGLWKFACIMTQTAQRWLGCPYQSWAGAPNETLTDALICEIFAGGNFGRKQEDKFYETYLISSRGKDGVGRTTMLRQFFISLNDMVSTHWAAAKRIPILFPAGWLFFGCRYFWRIVRGKRPPFRPKKIIQNAAERKSLYKEFELFEMQEGKGK